jgi:Holliday junction resolvasome RuvABC endonuclease subunit
MSLRYQQSDILSVGIDIASVKWSALATARGGKPRTADIWKPDDERDSEAVKIAAFYSWLRRRFFIIKPDVVAVEELAVFLNKNTIRSLSRREGVALLAAKQSGAIVVNPGISKARGIVFGNGRLSKDDAWLAFKKLYPDFPLLAKNSGGSDQMDAATHALAATTVLERRR